MILLLCVLKMHLYLRNAIETFVGEIKYRVIFISV